jgi:hypothetical protein
MVREGLLDIVPGKTSHQVAHGPHDVGWASENWSMNNVSLRTLAKGVRRMKGKRGTTE